MEIRMSTITLALCICSILIFSILPISVARAIEYSAYDGPFFSVQYPADWQISGKTTSFAFYDVEKAHYINISVGTNYSTIKIQNDYPTFHNGSFDEPTMHFLSTLKFKSYLVGLTNESRGSAEAQGNSELSPSGTKNAKYWLKIGIDMANQSKYDEAIDAFDKAININPRYADAWYYKGNALRHQYKYNESIKAYDKAIEINPRDADALYYKGTALGNLGRYNESIQAFEGAIQINSKDEDAWYGIGRALYHQDRYNESILAYDRALDIDPYDTDAWYYKGDALRYLHRYNESLEAYDQAIEIDPEDADSWYYKGVSLEALGRYAEADEAFSNAEELGFGG